MNTEEIVQGIEYVLPMTVTIQHERLVQSSLKMNKSAHLVGIPIKCQLDLVELHLPFVPRMQPHNSPR